MEEIVREHWQRHRPKAWAAMGPAGQDEFARRLARQIEDEVDNLAAEQERLIPKGLDYESKVARLASARSEAQRQVLAEMLWPAEDDEAAG